MLSSWAAVWKDEGICFADLGRNTIFREKKKIYITEHKYTYCVCFFKWRSRHWYYEQTKETNSKPSVAIVLGVNLKTSAQWRQGFHIRGKSELVDSISTCLRYGSTVTSASHPCSNRWPSLLLVLALIGRLTIALNESRSFEKRFHPMCWFFSLEYLKKKYSATSVYCVII